MCALAKEWWIWRGFFTIIFLWSEFYFYVRTSRHTKHTQHHTEAHCVSAAAAAVYVCGSIIAWANQLKNNHIKTALAYTHTKFFYIRLFRAKCYCSSFVLIAVRATEKNLYSRPNFSIWSSLRIKKKPLLFLEISNSPIFLWSNTRLAISRNENEMRTTNVTQEHLSNYSFFSFLLRSTPRRNRQKEKRNRTIQMAFYCNHCRLHLIYASSASTEQPTIRSFFFFLFLVGLVDTLTNFMTHIHVLYRKQFKCNEKIL